MSYLIDLQSYADQYSLGSSLLRERCWWGQQRCFKEFDVPPNCVLSVFSKDCTQSFWPLLFCRWDKEICILVIVVWSTCWENLATFWIFCSVKYLILVNAFGWIEKNISKENGTWVYESLLFFPVFFSMTEPHFKFCWHHKCDFSAQSYRALKLKMCLETTDGSLTGLELPN